MTRGDDLGRVVIPKEIRRTMHIREGDPLEIYTARDGELIFKKYSPIGELSDFAGQICDSLRKNANSIAAVCDRDAVIAVSGAGKQELIELPVSQALGELMESRSAYLYERGKARMPVSDRDEKYRIAAAAPVLSEGDVMGCVAFISKNEDAPVAELELKLVKTIAGFLGKQLES